MLARDRPARPSSPAGSPVALRGPAVAVGLLVIALPSLIAIVHVPERPGRVSAVQCPPQSESSLATASMASGLGWVYSWGAPRGGQDPNRLHTAKPVRAEVDLIIAELAARLA